MRHLRASCRAFMRFSSDTHTKNAVMMFLFYCALFQFSYLPFSLLPTPYPAPMAIADIPRYNPPTPSRFKTAAMALDTDVCNCSEASHKDEYRGSFLLRLMLWCHNTTQFCNTDFANQQCIAPSYRTHILAKSETSFAFCRNHEEYTTKDLSLTMPPARSLSKRETYLLSRMCKGLHTRLDCIHREHCDVFCDPSCRTSDHVLHSRRFMEERKWQMSGREIQPTFRNNASNILKIHSTRSHRFEQGRRIFQAGEEEGEEKEREEKENQSSETSL